MPKSGLLVVLILAMAACQTMDQGVYPLTKSDIDRYTSVRWQLTQPILRPVAKEDMSVYLRVRNSAGVEVPLQAMIETELENRGYRVVSSMEEAWYYLNIDVRHIDKGKLPDLGNIATGGSNAADYGAPTATSFGKTSTFDKNFNRQVESSDTAMVVDIISGERVPKGTIVREVRTTGSQGQDAGVDPLTQGRTGNRSADEGNASVSTQSVTTEDDFVFYANRAVAITKIRSIELEEALPSLTERLGKAMASALP